jgi:hypothetical protein
VRIPEWERIRRDARGRETVMVPDLVVFDKAFHPALYRQDGDALYALPVGCCSSIALPRLVDISRCLGLKESPTHSLMIISESRSGRSASAIRRKPTPDAFGFGLSPWAERRIFRSHLRRTDWHRQRRARWRSGSPLQFRICPGRAVRVGEEREL